MHVQVIINNDVTRDRVSDNLSAAKSSLWNENYGNALRIDQNHKSLDVRVNRRLIATARLCHRPPEEQSLYQATAEEILLYPPTR